jgi:hydroxymethylglutaryl-CoA lyase
MLGPLPQEVKVFEVGPRDGLQNEAAHVSTKDKIKLIETIAAAGVKNIEITSFVSPKWIPQLADGAEVAAKAINSLPADVITTALVPNLKGYEAAKQAGLKHIAVFMSATESHSHKNINKSIDEALAVLKEVIDSARADNIWVRAYMSVVFACPYEGQVDRNQAASVMSRLIALGIDELSIGDTIGAATPGQVAPLIELVSKEFPLSKIALHFHDTRGTALANVLAGLDCGVSIFDASIAGMGGCPYAPGAAGNLATEDLVYMLNGLGIKCGIDLEKLTAAGEFAQSIVQRKLPGRYLQAAIGSNGSKNK